MKVSPLAQGTGVPAASDSSLGRTADPAKLERAKAIAQGQSVEALPDAQAERVQQNIKKIKMKTQVSQNRHEFTEPEMPQVEESPIVDTNEQAPVVEETKPLSPQFAALAKAKRALQVKERELAQREEALKSAPAGEDWKANLKANPLSVLQDAGVTYEQLTEAILNSQNAPIDPNKLRSELKEELKKELLNEFGTRDQQAEQQVLSEMKREVLGLTSEGDDYQAIREAKAEQQVVNLVHRVWQKGWPDKGYPPGYVMDVTEAAQYVEDQLIEEALPFAKLKKVQSRLTPAEEAEQAVQNPAVPKPNTKIMRTLTNRDNASPTGMDRRSRAIAAMLGTLKR